MLSTQRFLDGNRSETRQFGHLSIDKLTAGILAALLAVPSPLSASVSWGGAITLMIAPVTLPTLWRDSRGRWLIIALLALVPSGWLVAQISLLQDSSRSFNNGFFLFQAAMAFGLIASLIGAYWCITKLGLQRFLLIIFASMFAARLLAPTTGIFDANPWKYGLAVPVSMLAILLLARNRPLLGFVIAPMLVAVSIAADLRSWAGFLCLTTILGVHTRRRRTNPSASEFATLGLIVVMAGSAVGWLTAKAAAAGILGDYLEQRTSRQLEFADGNLLLGGRPEWGAATALWRENPLGIGIGVAPSSDDYWLAIRSMPMGSLDNQENSGVAFYFRQGQVDFHSTFWTFWGIYGPAGILFAILATVYIGRAMATAVKTINQVNLRAAVILLMVFNIWDIFFSPTTVVQLAIALAVAVTILRHPPTVPSVREESPYERSPTH